MNIKESNKLIMEFEEWKAHQFHLEYHLLNGQPLEVVYNLDNPPPYHKSWDWLMPVIEKIESLDTSFTICYLYCFVERNGQDFRLLQGDSNCGETKLESAYIAVVEFIKWYNKEKGE